MRVFGRQADAAPAAPLTREERDERDRKAALAEARAIAAHERAVADDLKARPQAASEPVPVPDVWAQLLAALTDATTHGAATLRARLDELTLDYEVAPLLVEYQRYVAALRRAVGNFRPTPPLSAKDCDGLAAALRAEIGSLVAALVRHAEDDRAIAAARANRWLNEWARMARRIPDDEKLADTRDEAAFNRATADQRPAREVTIEPVLDVDEGAHTRLYTLRYPVPREGDYS